MSGRARPPPPPPKGRPPPPPRPPGGPPPPPQRAPSAFDETKLPSVAKDGLTPAEERRSRRRTCRFLEECGRILRLPRVAVATALVFFHRFYARHSFREHDRFEVAVACLLLAAKTEESPKRVTAVVQECYRLKSRAAAANRAAGKSPGSSGGFSPSPGHAGGLGGGGGGGASGGLTPPPTGSTPGSNGSGSGRSGGGGGGSSGGGGRDDKEGLLDPKGEEYIKLKERILLLERVVLHTIGFELDIHHPYKFLVDQIKKLTQARALEYASPPPGDGGSGGGKASSSSHKMTQELVQYGMNFANDSLHTTLCLQFPARVVAAACAYLACRMCKVRPVRGQGWPDLLGVPAEDLASISVQLMELIAEKKGCDLAVFKDIRADLDAMTGGTGGDGGPAKRPRTN